MEQDLSPNQFCRQLFPDLVGAQHYVPELLKALPEGYDHDSAVRERQQKNPEKIELCEGVF